MRRQLLSDSAAAAWNSLTTYIKDVSIRRSLSTGIQLPVNKDLQIETFLI